jgi:hypothetical protein
VRLEIIVALPLLFTTPTMAGRSAGYGMGGQFARFDPVVSRRNQSGELFRIGPCYSARTSPEPPNSAGKSFSFGRPSLIGSTVSA